MNIGSNPHRGIKTW